MENEDRVTDEALRQPRRIVFRFLIVVLALFASKS